MNYLVGDFSEADWDLVLPWVSDGPMLRRRLERWRKEQLPAYPMRLALDRGSRSFLFRSPSFAREQENGYTFFFQEILYDLSVSELERRVYVWRLGHAGDAELNPALKGAITEAFSVYGRYGHGPDGRDGKMRGWHRVEPKFGYDSNFQPIRDRGEKGT